MIGFKPFPRVLVLYEMQSVSSRIWTRVAVSISSDDNHYTTGTSNHVTMASNFKVCTFFVATFNSQFLSVTKQIHRIQKTCPVSFSSKLISIVSTPHGKHILFLKWIISLEVLHYKSLHIYIHIYLSTIFNCFVCVEIEHFLMLLTFCSFF